MEDEAAFTEAVRDLVGALAAGSEPARPAGGLARVLRETGAASTRAAVGALVDRWFRAPPSSALGPAAEPILNRPDIGEPEKLYAVLREHVIGQARWQQLSSNESTFYRYRRAAVATFTDHLSSEIGRPIPTNRPRPEYVRLVGRRAEVSQLLRLLAAPGGGVVGVEGPGGSGKTALLHAVADACESAARSWRPAGIDGGGAEVPVVDAVVWVGHTVGGDLSHVLDAVARTLDYPGLLARTLEDRRQAIRDLLAHRTVLLVVDDVDQVDSTVLPFLEDLPRPSRAIVAARRRLPPEVRALMPRPLAPAEARELLVAEAERQGTPALGLALVEGEAGEPLQATARYPLLAGWAVGQLRRGQTVERVRERLARAEGEVFGEMFAGSIASLSAGARGLLAVLPILPGSATRATVLAAGGPGAEAALDELLELSLLEVTGAPTDAERRYALHAVTRSFVAVHLPSSPPATRAAVARLIEHVADLAQQWGGAVPNWRHYNNLDAEMPTILAIVEAATLEARDRDGEPPGDFFDRQILRISYGMRNVFWFGRSWAEGLTLFHRAREAARRLGDRLAEGWDTYRLGALHYELGTGGYAEAALRAREAAELLGEAGDRRGRGHALRLLGRAIRARGNLPEAERLLAEAEALLAAYGHGNDLAVVRASHADLLRLSGRSEDAAELYESVLAGGLDDPGTEANIRNDLAEIALAAGRLDQARASFDAAERLAEAAGARAILARCHLGQARLASLENDDDAASGLAAAAADEFERLGDTERAYAARSLALRAPVGASEGRA